MMGEAQDWQEVKGLALSKIKSVEEMLPKPAENQLNKPNPKIWETEYRIIEETLMLDWTIEQWCMLAGISLQSYYKHKEKNPDFARRMEIARQFPKVVARAAIQRRIRQWDAKVALDYLKLRDRFYKEDAKEEIEANKAPVVQFISVASDEWNTTNPDTQTNIKQGSAWQWFASSWEAEKMTPRENEEQALRNIDLLSFNNE